MNLSPLSKFTAIKIKPGDRYMLSGKQCFHLMSAEKQVRCDQHALRRMYDWVMDDLPSEADSWALNDRNVIDMLSADDSREGSPER